MKKIAIIGANDSIKILIDKAKSIGFETHVFAWKCGDPGESAADYFYPISVDDKEQILEKCKKIGIAGVCSITSDFAVSTVNFISQRLGLPGNNEKTSILARNKYKMRCAFRDAGIFTPKFYQVNNNFEIDTLRDISFPVIVKPVDRWSSKGVMRAENVDQLKTAVEYATKESLEGNAIIEEFMNGPEYSAECICQYGICSIIAFTQKTTSGHPYYIETGHTQPSDILIDDYPRIKQVILKGLKALEIENGAAHAEFRILDNGEIGIIEIGARMGGDCIGTHLTPTSTGIDYVKMVIDVSCGNSLNFDVVSAPTAVSIKYIIEQEDINDYEQLRIKHPEKIITVSHFDDNFTKRVVDSSTRHGYYIFKL